MPAAQTAPVYLDLDEVVEPNIVIKFKGEEHKLKEFTLADWVSNTKEIQKLAAANGDLELESNVIITMITRSFPSLSADVLNNMPMTQLNKILAFANGNNGTDAVNKEVQAQAKLNPPSAPAEAPADIAPKA